MKSLMSPHGKHNEAQLLSIVLFPWLSKAAQLWSSHTPPFMFIKCQHFHLGPMTYGYDLPIFTSSAHARNNLLAGCEDGDRFLPFSAFSAFV